MSVEITETKPVWVVWTNTDLTEGRGWQRVKFVCESKATAIRLARKGYVMGSDCPITKDKAVKVGSSWYYPGNFEMTTDNDKNEQAKIDHVNAIVSKLNSLGVSNDEIKALISAGGI